MAASLPLFRRALADSWRSLIGWSLGVVAALGLYLPLFPSLGGSEQLQQLIDSLPPELVRSIGYDQIATGAGYTQSTFYGLIGFLLLTIASVSWGTAAIAGDEESGSLELTLAHGVGRVQVVLERAAALIVRLAWLAALAAAIVIALTDSAQLDIRPANAVAASAALLGLVLVFGMVSLAVGAATGRRSYALAAGAGAAVASYAVNAIANQNSDLEFLHAWTPLHWAYGNSPLMNGTDGMLAVLYGVATVLLAIAAVVFSRRDIAG